ncbi:hypothetical protein ABIC76_005033 [Ralstonia sp. 1138]
MNYAGVVASHESNTAPRNYGLAALNKRELGARSDFIRRKTKRPPTHRAIRQRKNRAALHCRPVELPREPCPKSWQQRSPRTVTT